MNSSASYSIRETLFTSTKSRIYRATRTADQRPVILKVLHADFPSTEQVARLHREYRLTRDVAMDGVIEVFGLERFGTSTAIVLEDFGGESLAQRLSSRPLELPHVLSVAIRLADILGRVHRRHVIHKDINPSNIVWNSDTDKLALIDFGIATELSRETPTVLNPNVLEGTLPYLSPEATGRMNRVLDYRTDFYSLGVTLYELLTGQLPFTATDPMELVHCHIARVPVPPCERVAGLPVTLSNILLRLLSKRAEERYQSAFSLAMDLQRCLDEVLTTGTISTFELAQGDVSERFQLPQKLYGRTRQLDELLAAFDRVNEGATELVLVAGYSGMGKSALVHEVHKPIVKRRGYFVSGKFDQFNRNIPYDSLIQALQELIRQLLAEPPERLARWRAELLAAVGPNISLLIDVLPEVELIVGAQPKAPELPPAEAQNRFTRTLESFVRTFAGPEHPLVVFLDDLQWADLPSLELIERLTTDASTKYLLLLGAYRDNETDASHPLVHMLARMREDGATLSTLTLGPLLREHCIQILAEALSSAAPDVEPLADLAVHKTGGNPFFLGQFLLSLNEAGMIVLDERTRRWTWDMDRISRTPMTNNVVELMAAKIQKLPEDTQRVLRLAACIGNTFDLNTLTLVDARPPRETADSLWAGLREGLILPLDDAYKFIEDRSVAEGFVTGHSREPAAPGEKVAYRFLHDRVQQAAYSWLPEGQRRELHLRIGRLMLSGLAPEARDEQLFTIVGHLNLGSELLSRQEERDELAELNLLAGRKAQSSAARTAAMRYLEAGLALLGEERWTRHYPLTLALHTQAAEASLMSTDFERMEHHADQVLEYARSPLDLVKVYEVKIRACTVQNQLQEAVRTARRIFALLGIMFPEQPTPEHVRIEITKLRTAMGQRRIEELIELPPMTDPVMLAATRIFAIIFSAAYIGDRLLFPLLVLRQIQIAVKYGNTGAVAYGYGTYGMVLLGMRGDIESAYAFGKLSLRVLERYDAREYVPRTLYLWHYFIRHWKEHARESFRGLQEVYRTGLDLGDLEFAGWAAQAGLGTARFLGLDLAEFERSSSGWLQAIAQIKQESALYMARISCQTALNLRGVSADPCRLIGTAYDEDKQLPVHLEANHVSSLAALFTCKTQLCYLFGRHTEALAHAVMAERYLGGAVATHAVPTFYFFDSLVRLALYSGMSTEEREQTVKRVEDGLAKMKIWAEHAPMNNGAKHALMAAERHRVLGEVELAREEYYRAIELAREHEYRNDEALATELFAAFLAGRREHEVARLFRAKARHLYHLWGAEAKVAQLDRTFPELRTVTMSSAPSKVSDTTTSELTHPSSALDLVSVLKASQAISGERVLTHLLEKLMQIVIENAGARWGVLILEDERPLVAVAKQPSKDGPGGVTLHESLEQTPVAFSEAIVRYVQRTQEVVVLDDASTATSFDSDPYIAANRPKSVLCMPIIHHKKRAGILYLENELLANAFTPERCKVLELLTAQAAISLENAKLYDTLEMRVKERTRELSETLQRLQDTQKQLILQEKLASLGSLTSGIAHEIKNPLNFVSNFAESAVSLVAELREELKHQREDPKQARPENVEQILDDLSQGATKIRENSARADRIVRAMLEHARTGSGKIRQVELNALVREHVSLAMSGRKVRAGSEMVMPTLLAHYDESLGSVSIAPEDIGRVILNLTNNALYTLAAKKKTRGSGFTPQLMVSTQDLGERFEIRIRDNGMGIPTSVREKICTPFFTTKPPGEGTGLGLSISHDIVVQGHGGGLSFTSAEGEYTEFVLVLPKRASIGQLDSLR
ncbi:Serine/threonine protein kinase PrkC, regulator of stationary phase [Cystobacter fuscus DSM 2262]|uniref:histidine kinase n=1 Tax=Cystobacter fuscus (strain ATCC 25194 / DSM 2262 / NBRC 100088 / M29) TaxID=1242864 RepID=S9R6Q6_CYSF2|nr:AAA family ATPase [Cystobacter fuscus]EPX64688.1 Serine/threonine protein kinase PrkC, regulator of stationary phase [Cystobacter fuscus DSM 2262]